MFQMSAVQLKALLNKACKVVDKVCTFLLGDCLNLFSEGYLQYNNGSWVALIDFVLEEHSEKEIQRFQVRQVRFPFHFSFAIDEMLPKFFMRPCHSNLAVWGGISSGWNHCSSLLKSLQSTSSPMNFKEKMVLRGNASRWRPMPSNQFLKVLIFLKHPVLGFNMTIQE